MATSCAELSASCAKEAKVSSAPGGSGSALINACASSEAKEYLRERLG